MKYESYCSALLHFYDCKLDNNLTNMLILTDHAKLFQDSRYAYYQVYIFTDIARFNIVTIKLTSLFLDLWYRENNVSCMKLHFIYSALMFV